MSEYIHVQYLDMSMAKNKNKMQQIFCKKLVFLQSKHKHTHTQIRFIHMVHVECVQGMQHPSKGLAELGKIDVICYFLALHRSTLAPLDV